MPTLTTSTRAPSNPSSPRSQHPTGASKRSPRRQNLSWSGPLSSLFRATPSPSQDLNAFVFPSATAPAPINRESYKAFAPPRSPNATLPRTPLLSLGNTMPVGPYPYPPAPYQHLAYGKYSDRRESTSSRLPHQRHNYSNSIPSSRNLSVRDPPYANVSSPYQHQSPTYLTESTRTKRSSTSANYLQTPSSRHQRSRSDSFSLPYPAYEDRTSRYPAYGSPSPGEDMFDSPRGRRRERTRSFSQLQSVRPRSSSLRPPGIRSRRSSLRSPADTAFMQESRRVRFVVPASLHQYLYRPPFEISLNRPIPSALAAHYQPYISHPATNPSVSFLLITTPHLPWPIRLTAPPISTFPSATYHHAPLAYLSVHDVVNGVYTALRKPVTLREYESLAADLEFRDKVVAAYGRRKAREMGGGDEYMRRVDWLAGRTVFCGLEPSRKSEGVWELRLGWGKAL